MSRLLIAVLALLAAGALWFWSIDGFDRIALWAAGEQREFQTGIARSLRGLRAGDAGALAVLLSVSFAYGFVHAVGPGHGKVLLGGYGLARRVPMLRLAAVGLVSSLAQALTAIALVYCGIWLFALTREHLIGVAERAMAPLSYGAIALVGLWLMVRGLRHGWKMTRPEPAHDHHHHHDHHHGHQHDGACGCGHRHAPTPEEIAGAGSLRELAALVAGIAIRPCTGAIFVLLITWQMGIPAAGIAAALAMALGTAMVTVAVGASAAGLRGGVMGALAGSRLAARALPVLEIAGGAAIVALTTGLLLRSLS